MTTSEHLDALWRDYVALCPQAERIRRLLVDRGEVVHHDHVALMTFDSIGIAELAKPFEAHGFSAREQYRHDAQHLRARYWRHTDPNLPKIFISEIAVGELSPGAQAAVRKPRDELTHAEYRALRDENALAAWVAAFGARVHHFTLDVSALVCFPDLSSFVAFLKEHGFDVTYGGTRCDDVNVAFADRTLMLPCASYDFVFRQEPVSVAK